jgi:hypothetical protein
MRENWPRDSGTPEMTNFVSADFLRISRLPATGTRHAFGKSGHTQHQPGGSMHDETVPIEATPETPAPVASPPRPLPHWLKRLFVCNPFFLASAMLLLYGLYRVSIDPNFLATEVAQLTFNFTSLQCYELLLVVTAAVLARRHLWHDSTVLVLLENLFLLVPFILISQAALIEPRFVWSLCAVAVALAGARTEAARRAG